MNESTLKGHLVRRLRDALLGFVVIRHEERFNSGTPDMSVTGLSHTTWWEVKYANPRFESSGVQKLMLNRLAKSGYARYIVFVSRQNGERPQTMIVHPQRIDEWKTGWAHLRSGYDYDWLINYIKAAHIYEHDNL